jgi:hypothetical protein
MYGEKKNEGVQRPIKKPCPVCGQKWKGVEVPVESDADSERESEDGSRRRVILGKRRR